MNSTVSVELIPNNSTYYVGDSFIINVTNSTVAKVTVNGKEYAVLADGSVNITTSDLAANDYVVVVSIPENDYYYANSTNVSFKVIKRASEVSITVNDTYVIGSDFNITVSNNTAVNVTVNGKVYSVNSDGTVNVTGSSLSAGHYVVIATIYENNYYNGSVAKAEFDIIKMNSTVSVELIPNNSTYYVGDSFIINVTNSTVAKVTVNGKEYAVLADGSVNITTSDLAANDYVVVVSIPENDYYYANSTNVSFKIIKKSSEVSITVNDTYVIGTDFNITVSNNTAVNVTVNGKTYSLNSDGTVNVTGSSLSAGHYVVIATIYENNYYNGSVAKAEFDIIKMNSTVLVELIPNNSTYYVGDSFIINVTNSTAAKVTVNGKEYAILEDGTVNITTADLDANDYIVVVTIPENDYYYANSTTAEFTLIKRQASVNISVGETYMYGDSFSITVENSTYVNVTINGKTYSLNSDGTVNITTSDLPAGNYVIIATSYENRYYLANSTVKSFDIIKWNSTVNITVLPDTTHYVGDSFTIAVTNNTVAEVTVNGKQYAVLSDGTVNITTAELAAGTYTVVAETPENSQYYANSSSLTFTIIKYTPSVNITVGSEYECGSDFNITVENSTAVNVTINGKSVSVNADGTLDINSTSLDAGNYVITATVYENDYYYGITVQKEFNITRLVSHVNITVEPDTVHIVGDNFTIKVFNDTEATVTINGDAYDIVNGTVNIDATALSAGNYTVIASIAESGKYYANSSTLKFSIIKLESHVNITVGSEFVYGDSFTITVENDTAVNVTINGKAYTVSDSKVVIDTTVLPAGDYVVIATIYENARYFQSMDTKEFKIIKLNSTVSIDITPDAPYYVGDDITITVTNNTYANVTINGNNYEISADGKVVIDTTALPAGEYTVIASIAENPKYFANSTTARFTINKLQGQVSLNITPDTTHYIGDSITVKVTNNTAVSVVINGVSYDVLSDGTVDVDTSGFASGTYIVTAEIAENDVYLANSTSASFTINKLDSHFTISADDIYYGDDAVIVIVSPDNQTGFVNIIINNQTYSVKITDGKGKLNVSGLVVGSYDINGEYTEDDIFLASSNSTSFNVLKANLTRDGSSPFTANVIAENVTDHENSTFFVLVPEQFNGLVNITVDNYTYSGSAESLINMAVLTAGDKVAEVVFWNDTNFNDFSFNTPFKVSDFAGKVNLTTIKSDNLTRGYNSIYDFQATFLDSNGNALKNTDVQFIVDGKTYTVKTNNDGIAQLTTSKLDVGVYNVTIINSVTGESTENVVTIVARIIEDGDLTMDFLSGEYYVVKVIGDDGNPVGEGEIIDIYVNTIHYVSVTDSDGYSRLKINLNPKSYTITAEYKTYKVIHKLKVKQTLKLVKKTVKVKKGKKLVLKAKLKWSTGKAIKGKKIVFKFKGKKYTAKTNKKGIAKVKIKKKVTKKLKKGKKYKYSAKYVTNKVKGKVKVKK